mgnify:CR=1 FL=1
MHIDPRLSTLDSPHVPRTLRVILAHVCPASPPAPCRGIGEPRDRRCLDSSDAEALAGGPLGKVREGDLIEIVIDNVLGGNGLEVIEVVVGHAVQVADPFHLVRLANEAVREA